MPTAPEELMRYLYLLSENVEHTTSHDSQSKVDWTLKQQNSPHTEGSLGKD